MKRFFIMILSLIVILVAGIYLIIPSQIEFKRDLLVNANPQGVYRVVANEKNWKNWMISPPGNFSTTTNSTSLTYGELGYRIKERLMNSIEIITSDGSSTLFSTLNVLPISQDSSALEWRSSVPSGNNPFRRISIYRLAKRTRNNIDGIFSGMKPFLSENKNIYHLDIYQRLVKDTVMMSTKDTFSNYPSTDDIYEMIERVRTHVRKHNGHETNFPMLNINVHNDSRCEVMVAIPVDHSLPEQGNILQKRMLYKGNLLEAEVIGGVYKIRQAFSDFKNYVTDNGRTPAAIPYEMLITDRSKEPDTSKWVTKLFYPVY